MTGPKDIEARQRYDSLFQGGDVGSWSHCTAGTAEPSTGGDGRTSG